MQTLSGVTLSFHDRGSARVPGAWKRYVPYGHHVPRDHALYDHCVAQCLRCQNRVGRPRSECSFKAAGVSRQRGTKRLPPNAISAQRGSVRGGPPGRQTPGRSLPPPRASGLAASGVASGEGAPRPRGTHNGGRDAAPRPAWAARYPVPQQGSALKGPCRTGTARHRPPSAGATARPAPRCLAPPTEAAPAVSGASF